MGERFNMQEEQMRDRKEEQERDTVQKTVSDGGAGESAVRKETAVHVKKPKKKKIIAFIAVFLILAICAGVGGYFLATSKGQEPEKETETILSTPTNVNLDDSTIKWDDVAGAAGFVVLIDDMQYQTSLPVLNLLEIGLESGTYSCRVKAISAKDNQQDSGFSVEVPFTWVRPVIIYTLQVISEDGGSTNITKKDYAANSVVDLIAYPKEKYHFDGWYSDKYYKIGSDTSFSFVMNSDTVIFANFSPNAETISKSATDDSEIMNCPQDFAVVALCTEESGEEYIREHFAIYDDYFLGDDGKVVSGYESYSTRTIGAIESKGNNLYVIYPASDYEKSGAYVAKATGNVSILKEYSRFMNNTGALNAAGNFIDDSIETLADDEGIENLTFSIDNTPHEDISLRDDVYIYSYKDNDQATATNVDGWILERIGTGITDDDTGVLGGFITESVIVRNNYRLQPGDIVGFGGYITKNITVDQITDGTVFGKIKTIGYFYTCDCGVNNHEKETCEVCGKTAIDPIIFVELGLCESPDEVFAVLDVYREGDVDIEEYVEANNAAITEEITEQFYREEDFQKFLAAVEVAAERYTEENELTTGGPMNASSFLDKTNINPKIETKNNTFVLTLKGNIDIGFWKKDKYYEKAGGKLSISFEFVATLKFEYNFAWIMKKVWFVSVAKGIDLKIIMTQDTSFTFDVAVKYTENTQSKEYLLNENTKWIHLPSCWHVKQMNEGNKKTTTDTLKELEEKGYTPCKDCIRSRYTMNTNTMCVHKADCWHVGKMLPSNKKPSNLDLDDILAKGYHACKTCLGGDIDEGVDMEETEDFRDKISKALKYEDWGDKLKEIKNSVSGAEAATDANKDLLICDIPFFCVVTIHFKAYLSLSFNIEASVHYKQEAGTKVTIGIRAVIGDGFRTTYAKEETANSFEFTAIGKMSTKAGVKLEIGVNDPIGLVYIGVYGSAGVYSDLAGILHLSTNGENYTAAYFELGFYYDFGMTYKIFYLIKGSVSLNKTLGLSGKIPFLKMGYDKAIYAYENDIEEVLLQASEVKKEFSLKELLLLNVKNISLPSLKTGTETLDITSDDYKVNLSLAKGDYFYIDSETHNIKVKDDAPFGTTFEDELVIAIESTGNFWTVYTGTKPVLYLPTITVRLICASKCEEHSLIYLPEQEATCTESGLEECLLCTRCNKMFNAEQTTEITARVKIAALGHDTVIIDGVDATCVENGLTEGKFCLRCQEWLIPQETITALGHTESETWETAEAPTCQSQGTESNACARCGLILSYRVVLPVGHTPNTYDPDCGEEVVCITCEKVLAKAREHNYIVIDSKDPSCEAIGYKQYQCNHCYHTYREDISATGHSAAEDAEEGEIRVSKPVSCTEDGEYTYTCSYCQKEIAVPIKALGHILSDFWTIDKAATCEEQGQESRHCLRDGCSYYTDVRLLPVLEGGHYFGEWSVTKEPDCENVGEKCRICSRCGKIETESIDAKGHNWSIWIKLSDSTCVIRGVSYRQCLRCEKTEYQYADALGHDAPDATCEEASVCKRCKEELAPALGHDFQISATEPAQCEIAGKITYLCSRCPKEKEEPIKATGHKWIVSSTTQPTCTERGILHYSCENDGCGSTKDETDMTENGNPTGHNYNSEYTVDKVATCTEKGSKSRHCLNDGCTAITDIIEIDPIPHSWGEAIAYDFETNGKKCDEIGSGYRECSVCHQKEDVSLSHTPSGGSCTVDDVCTRCGEVLEAAEGHVFQTLVFRKDSTCTEKGYEMYKCSKCGEPNSELTELPIKGHDEIAFVTEPTCTQQGYTTYICKVCEAKRIDDYIDALDHNYTATVTHETCTTDGYTTQKCIRCGSEYTDSKTVAHGHNFVLTDHKDATCTEDGYDRYDCQCVHEYCECSETKTDILPALGHIEKERNAQDATCVSVGYTAEIYCERCGEVLINRTETPIDISNHNLVDAAGQEASCTEAGWNAYKYCSREGCTYSTKAENMIGAKGHTSSGDDAVAATCVSIGLTAGSHCGTCGEVLIEQKEIPIDPNNHVHLTTHESKDATCTEAGWAQYMDCPIAEGGCGYTTYTEKEATGHQTTYYAKVDATCTEDGNAEYWHCSRCDKNFSDESCDTLLANIVLEKTGHSIEMIPEHLYCEKEGNKEYWYCAQCDTCFSDEAGKQIIIKKDVVLPAQGHNMVVSDFVPGGYETKTCQRGECTYSETTYVEHTITLKPNCGGLLQKTETSAEWSGHDISISYTSDTGTYILTTNSVNDPYCSIDQCVYLEAGKTYYAHMNVNSTRANAIQMFYAIDYSYNEAQSMRFWGDKTNQFSVSTTGLYRIRIDVDTGCPLTVTDFYITDTLYMAKVKYDHNLPDVSIPVKDGYKFIGYFYNDEQWYNANGQGIVNDTQKKYDQTTDVTLIAQWSAEVYTIILDWNDSTVLPCLIENKTTLPSEVTLVFGLPFSFPSANCNYCVFNGWLINGEIYSISGASWNIDLGEMGDKFSATANWIKNFTPISNQNELSNIRNNPNGTYVLIDNIACLGEWDPISNFSGIIDGMNHTISDISITTWCSSNNDLVVGFCRQNSGTIKNVFFDGAKISVTNTKQQHHFTFMGVICGENYGIIENIKIYNSLVYVKLGSTDYSINCYVSVGIVAGVNNNNIINCHVDTSTAKGDTHTKDKSAKSYVGSIAGWAKTNSIISDCSVNNSATKAICYGSKSSNIFSGFWSAQLDSYAGGIVGYAIGATLANCSVTTGTTSIAEVHNAASDCQRSNSGTICGFKDAATSIINCV